MSLILVKFLKWLIPATHVFPGFPFTGLFLQPAVKGGSKLQKSIHFESAGCRKY